MKIQKTILATLAIFIHLAAARAQVAELKIGDVVPGHITFKDLKNYNKLNPTIDDFKGKLLILDFWSTGCTSCIAAMPKMEALQQQFRDSIQIILVNPWETKEKIEERTRSMKMYRPRIGLSSLPMANGDAFWKSLFPHRTVPHHVWINQSGKVIAISNGYNTTAANISKALHGTSPTLAIKRDLKAYGYDPWKVGLFLAGDSSLRTGFLSGFVKQNAGYGAGSSTLVDTTNNMYTKLWFNNSIQSFYQYAYAWQGIRTRTIIEANLDSSLRYSYQITIPLTAKEKLKTYVQQDLNRFFGVELGIVGGMETRALPSVVVKVQNVTLLKTLGAKKSYRKTADSLVFTNTPFSQVISVLQNIFDKPATAYLLDETAFSGNVDMVLKGDLHSRENLAKQLAPYGLVLKDEVRDLSVLMIKKII